MLPPSSVGENKNFDLGITPAPDVRGHGQGGNRNVTSSLLFCLFLSIEEKQGKQNLDSISEYTCTWERLATQQNQRVAINIDLYPIFIAPFNLATQMMQTQLSPWSSAKLLHSSEVSVSVASKTSSTTGCLSSRAFGLS